LRRPRASGTLGARAAFQLVFAAVLVEPGHPWRAAWSGTPPGSGSRQVATRSHLEGIPAVKNDIHPNYVVTEVTCSCGNSFTTRSTAKSGQMHAEVCSACHPFYTGKQKIMDVGGRVDKFEKRYGKRVRSS
jgi:large subunit ribosomal protein L31